MAQKKSRASLKVSNEFKVGALAVICVALLIIGYNILKGNAVFTSTNTYYATYDAVDGLTTSNPVKIKGVQVGRVTNIYLGDKVTIKLTIASDVKIPKGSIAKIVSPSPLGDREIAVELSKDTKYYSSGDTLLSGTEKGILDNLEAQIMPIKQKAETLLGSIDSVLTIVRTVLSPETQNDIVRSVKSITATLAHVDNSSASLDTLLQKNSVKLAAIFSNVESITATLKKNQDNLTAIFSNLNQLTDSLAKSNIKQTIGNAQTALKQVSVLLEKINKGEGSVGLLVNDDKLYNNVTQSSKDLDALFQDLKANPGRYIHISVFGRKEKTTPPTDGSKP